jgi:hypothetical protein
MIADYVLAVKHFPGGYFFFALSMPLNKPPDYAMILPKKSDNRPKICQANRRKQP